MSEHHPPELTLGVAEVSPCQTCGACCDYAPSWPRFSTESDEDLARIPAKLVARDHSGMRCHGNRCAALDGEIGDWVACTIYAIRPDVCRACQPGDEACRIARDWHGLPRLKSP